MTTGVSRTTCSPEAPHRLLAAGEGLVGRGQGGGLAESEHASIIPRRTSAGAGVRYGGITWTRRRAATDVSAGHVGGPWDHTHQPLKGTPHVFTSIGPAAARCRPPRGPGRWGPDGRHSRRCRGLATPLPPTGRRSGRRTSSRSPTSATTRRRRATRSTPPRPRPLPVTPRRRPPRTPPRTPSSAATTRRPRPYAKYAESDAKYQTEGPACIRGSYVVADARPHVLDWARISFGVDLRERAYRRTTSATGDPIPGGLLRHRCGA